MKFIIPVKFTGTKSYHITKPSLDEAVAEARRLIKQAMDCAQFGLTDTVIDVLAPSLMLKDTELADWPYWYYGQPGDDGSQWKPHFVDTGAGSIPDTAPVKYPVPESWVKASKTDKPAIEASVKGLMADNEHNLEDKADIYAQGYQDALLDVLAAMGVETPKKRFD